MNEIFKYIQSDYYRYTGVKCGGAKLIFAALFGRNHCFRYNFWFRLASGRNIVYPLAIFMHKHYSIKYGLHIQRGTKIGYGFYIGHGIGAVIHPNTVIGNNCNISQFLSIGSNHGTPAVIGDNVYIGPHVSIVENVKIGDNATIGAGAVVTNDIPANMTVAGVPAKIISAKNVAIYIVNKWKP